MCEQFSHAFLFSETVIISASLMGAGLLAQAIVGQKVNVGRRGRVVILD